MEPELNKKSIINYIDKDNYFLNMSENASKRNIFEKSGNVKRINTIKINEFKVEKPNEESLRFTLLKNEYAEESSEYKTSKIMIGEIEGYKDIIEDDKLNNEPFKKENTINILESKSRDIDSRKIKDKNNLILKEEKKYKETNNKNNNNVS